MQVVSLEKLETKINRLTSTVKVDELTLRLVKEYAEDISFPLPETKRGYWIHTDKERPDAPESVRCSVCGFWYHKLMPRHFCSNCGAEMVDEPLTTSAKIRPEKYLKNLNEVE